MEPYWCTNYGCRAIIKNKDVNLSDTEIAEEIGIEFDEYVKLLKKYNARKCPTYDGYSYYFINWDAVKIFINSEELSPYIIMRELTK